MDFDVRLNVSLQTAEELQQLLQSADFRAFVNLPTVCKKTIRQQQPDFFFAILDHLFAAGDIKKYFSVVQAVAATQLQELFQRDAFRIGICASPSRFQFLLDAVTETALLEKSAARDELLLRCFHLPIEAQQQLADAAEAYRRDYTQPSVVSPTRVFSEAYLAAYHPTLLEASVQALLELSDEKNRTIVLPTQLGYFRTAQFFSALQTLILGASVMESRSQLAAPSLLKFAEDLLTPAVSFAVRELPSVSEKISAETVPLWKHLLRRWKNAEPWRTSSRDGFGIHSERVLQLLYQPCISPAVFDALLSLFIDDLVLITKSDFKIPGQPSYVTDAVCVALEDQTFDAQTFSELEKKTQCFKTVFQRAFDVPISLSLPAHLHTGYRLFCQSCKTASNTHLMQYLTSDFFSAQLAERLATSDMTANARVAIRDFMAELNDDFERFFPTLQIGGPLLKFSYAADGTLNAQPFVDYFRTPASTTEYLTELQFRCRMLKYALRFLPSADAVGCLSSSALTQLHQTFPEMLQTPEDLQRALQAAGLLAKTASGTVVTARNRAQRL